MRRVFLLAAAINLGLIGSAFSATTTLTVIIKGKLTVLVNPTSATIQCDAPPGTFLARVSVSGGNANPVTLLGSGDTTDFALSSTTSPANIVVGPGGITSTGSSCATLPAAGATDTFTVQATQ